MVEQLKVEEWAYEALIVRKSVKKYLSEFIKSKINKKNYSKKELEALLNETEKKIEEALDKLKLNDLLPEKELNSQEKYEEHIKKVIEKVKAKIS